MKIPRDVFVAHGFQFDPDSERDNPSEFFDEIHAMLDRNIVTWSWYSAPIGFRHVLKAWIFAITNFKPTWNRYRYAWELARLESQKLAECLYTFNRDVDILGHSLGTRVILGALARDKLKRVKRVILLNGAEFHQVAHIACIRNPQIQFLNIVVRTDDVLKFLGEIFEPGDLGETIGHHELGLDAPSNWKDVVLDDPQTQKFAKGKFGWDLQGDNPKLISDHHFSFRHEGNWPLYRAFLDGQIDNIEFG